MLVGLTMLEPTIATTATVKCVRKNVQLKIQASENQLTQQEILPHNRNIHARARIFVPRVADLLSFSSGASPPGLLSCVIHALPQ